MAYTAADLNAEIIVVVTASITEGIASLSQVLNPGISVPASTSSKTIQL